MRDCRGSGFAAGIRAGHVHLHVGDVAAAEAFYDGVVGFDVMERISSAGFVAAAASTTTSPTACGAGPGCRPQPAGTVGLRHRTLVLPDASALAALQERTAGPGPPSRRSRRSRRRAPERARASGCATRAGTRSWRWRRAEPPAGAAGPAAPAACVSPERPAGNRGVMETQPEPPPVRSYALVAAAFALGLALFLRLARDRLPEQVAVRDVAQNAVAAHKLSRIVSREKVGAALRAPLTVDPAATEAPAHGTTGAAGLRRALGELVTCPYCLDLWIAAALTAGTVVAPRTTRFVTAALASHAGADFLQAAFVRARG